MECQEVTPTQVGFPGARLVARLETRVKRKDAQGKKKKWTREVVYLVSSLTLEELQAKGMLSAPESHSCLITMVKRLLRRSSPKLQPATS